jgi:hypothetical protein
MKIIFRPLLLLILIYDGTLCWGQAPNNAMLNLTLRPQEAAYWCWAASGQMIMEFHGTGAPQCDQVSRSLIMQTCCDSPTPLLCDQGGWPEFDKFGFNFQTTNNAPFSWEAICQEIGVENKPFAFSWQWKGGGGGHMMVAHGYHIVDGDRFISILDPFPTHLGDQRDITYEEYVEGPDHIHWNDFFAVTKSVDNIATVIPQNPRSEMQLNDGVGRKRAIKRSRNEAERSLDTYRKLQSNKNAGLSDNLVLGEPFPVVSIGLDELRENNNALSLKKTTEKVIYPINSSSKIQSGVTLNKKKNHWEKASYGNTTLTKLLVQARENASKEMNRSKSDYYVISILSLNLYFVAIDSGIDVLLFPVTDDPSLGIRSGIMVKSTQIIPKLVDAAQKHNGLPR